MKQRMKKIMILGLMTTIFLAMFAGSVNAAIRFRVADDSGYYLVTLTVDGVVTKTYESRNFQNANTVYRSYEEQAEELERNGHEASASMEFIEKAPSAPKSD